MDPRNLSIVFTPNLFDFDETQSNINAMALFRICPNILELLIFKRLAEKRETESIERSVTLTAVKSRERRVTIHTCNSNNDDTITTDFVRSTYSNSGKRNISPPKKFKFPDKVPVPGKLDDITKTLSKRIRRKSSVPLEVTRSRKYMHPLVWTPIEDDPDIAFVQQIYVETLCDGRIKVRPFGPDSSKVASTVFDKGISLPRVDEEELSQDVNDLIHLGDLSPVVVLFHLRKRFKTNLIYTRIGPTLIALNPYQCLNIYTAEILNQYRQDLSKSLPPHVFEIAREAYTKLLEGKDQSIIISGDSGAGKTESAKKCLSYLTEVSQKSAYTIEQKVSLTIPLTESFGNAKTVMNDNSSRFGKFCSILFDKTGKLSAVQISSYLLEKTRVVSQSADERNFHIFYQFLAGCDDDMKEKYFQSN